MWEGWRPRELADRLIEDGGAAPRLAAWAIVVWLGVLALAWVMWQGTLVVALWTQFRPVPVSLIEPALATSALVVLIAASRPAALALEVGLRWLDARWRRSGRRSLVTPRRIAAAITVASIAIGYAAWRWFVKRELGPLDVDLLRAPAAGVIACGLAHALRHRVGKARTAVGAGVAVVAAAAIASALYVRFARPALVLAIWGERPIAGLAIDLVFDIDAIRDDLPLGELAPPARAGARHPDIVLVTIDTVRADHTPPYGGTVEMPTLRALAERGAVFDWAFAPSNVTRRSIPSMMTGLAPNRVRGRVVGWALRMDPRHVLAPERLAAAGYDTAGFMCCERIWGPDSRTGMSRGLAHVETEPHENGYALAKRARAFIEDRDRRGNTRPLFVWMHLIEPHNWFFGVDPRNDDERRKLYDRSLVASDQMLAELLAAFTSRPADRQPIVIVTADHGEGLGDHGQPHHSTDLYNSQIRVPLVIAGPGVVAGHIAETVSLTELSSTLVDLAGFEPPHQPDGASFGELATGRRAAKPDAGDAFAAMIKDRSNPGGITAIVHGGWKLIDSGSQVELYDVHTDPQERSNLVTAKPLIVEELRRLLERAVAAGETSPFDP